MGFLLLDEIFSGTDPKPMTAKKFFKAHLTEN